MNKWFEQLCILIDEFWQVTPYTKPGAKPKQFPDFYLKLYFFGLLSKSPDKCRWLERAIRQFPHIFKKTISIHRFTTFVDN